MDPLPAGVYGNGHYSPPPVNAAHYFNWDEAPNLSDMISQPSMSSDPEEDEEGNESEDS